MPASRRGSLLIVGTGIGLGGQITVEALEAIKSAERFLYVAGTPVAALWLRQVNPQAVSLHSYYAPDKNRALTYSEMVDRIMAEVRAGHRVVAAFYGHPGVCVDPGHEVIRVARSEGYRARMLPGISAEACLYADLGFDPLTTGCQTYEASAFVAREPPISTAAFLVLWQVGVIGEVIPRYTRDACQAGLERLQRLLGRLYPADHEVIAYEAAVYPVLKTKIDRGVVSRLPELKITPATTLVVPPVGVSPGDLHPGNGPASNPR
jgi:hypothetical protein